MEEVRREVAIRSAGARRLELLDTLQGGEIPETVTR
jgi:hypothetical protein